MSDHDMTDRTCNTFCHNQLPTAKHCKDEREVMKDKRNTMVQWMVTSSLHTYIIITNDRPEVQSSTIDYTYKPEEGRSD